MKNIWIIFKIEHLLVASLFLFASCGSNEEGCPYCHTDLQPDQIAVDEDAEVQTVRMMWVGVIGAPSIDDPSLVCEEDFKNVLFRRHQRANACIWTKQCRVVMTVLGVDSIYGTISDPDASLGESGDVVINDDNTSSDEMDTMAMLAFEHFGQPANGILVIQVREFLAEDGKPRSVIGYGIQNDGNLGILFIRDDMFLPDNNHEIHRNTERTLGHEFGHVLGLCHVNEDGCNQEEGQNISGNLMFGDGGTPHDRTLLPSQCNTSRSRFPGIFTQTLQQQIQPHQHFFHGNSGMQTGTNAVRVYRKQGQTKGLQLNINANKVLKQNDDLVTIGFDLDNNADTGGNLRLLLPGQIQPGLEAVLQFSSVNKQEVKFFIFSNASFVQETGANTKIELSFENTKAFISQESTCESFDFTTNIKLMVQEDLLNMAGVPLSNYERIRTNTYLTKK